jgi:hypothetical protein
LTLHASRPPGSTLAPVQASCVASHAHAEHLGRVVGRAGGMRHRWRGERQRGGEGHGRDQARPEDHVPQVIGRRAPPLTGGARGAMDGGPAG